MRRPTDIVRALELDARFDALHLGLVDGIVAAVAERRRVCRVLTADHGDLGPLRLDPRDDVALVLVP
jgi:predicted nucleic acid-binding protein